MIFCPPASCRELGVGFVPYSPLGRGFLTGRIQRLEDLAEGDYRRHTPCFQGEYFQKNLDLVARVDDSAQQKHRTPGQLALAWVLAQGADIVPVPGIQRVAYPEEKSGRARSQPERRRVVAVGRNSPARRGGRAAVSGRRDGVGKRCRAAKASATFVLPHGFSISPHGCP